MIRNCERVPFFLFSVGMAVNNVGRRLHTLGLRRVLFSTFTVTVGFLGSVALGRGRLASSLANVSLCILLATTRSTTIHQKTLTQATTNNATPSMNFASQSSNCAILVSLISQTLSCQSKPTELPTAASRCRLLVHGILATSRIGLGQDSAPQPLAVHPQSRPV